MAVVDTKAPIAAENMTGTKKAAVFLVSLGAQASSQVYKYLSESEVERLSREIAMMDAIPSNVLHYIRHFNCWLTTI